MDKPDLTFADFFKKFDDLGKGEWIVAYGSYREEGKEWLTYYCGLVSESKVSKSLEEPSWDVQIGNGQPGFSYHWEDGKEIATYSRPWDEGVEPLVLSRGFHGMKEGYWEVLEEFRLYFNLYEDRHNNKFVLIDDNGDDEDVIVISENEIKIKTRLIKEFLAVKKVRMAMFFDVIRFSDKTIEELGIKEYHDRKKGEDFVYSIGARNWSGYTGQDIKAQGFLMGKKLISGLKDFKPSLFSREDKKFLDFIIGVDDEGREILHTSDEDKLANFFGKNEGSPYFVTPVFFKKEVLTKYYSQPGKYSVEDGYLRCGGMWGLRMDNNHADLVMVFLGDLGHLSYKEQMYWRGFNVATKEKMSYTAFARDFEAKFEDPEKADLFFKQRFRSFQEEWEKKYGWKFFRPLSAEDEHHFKTLRIPLTNEQKEFDEQVLSLVKIFIDSLNEKELSRGLALPSDSKGLDKLDAFLKSKNVRFRGLVEFLRDLQELRSAGVAHLKGSKYEKIKTTFSIGTKELPKVFEEILIKCVTIINSFRRHFLGISPDQDE